MFYTKEHVEFVREKAEGTRLTNVELTKMFNAKFKTDITKHNISYIKRSNGIKSRGRDYTDKEINYIKSIACGRKTEEITKMFNKRFDDSKTCKTIHSFMKRKKIKNGINERFKKGHRPRNTLDVGTERETKDGVLLKVEEPDVWMYKHRYLYEIYNNEKLTKNDVLVFLDGDKKNYKKENLVKLNKNQLKIINQNGLMCNIPALNRAGINIAKIKEQIYAAERKA